MLSRNHRRSYAQGLCLIVVIAAASQCALGLNIVMTFDSGASDNPSYDSTGSKLQAIMSSVEAYWQDIIEATGTLNVTYYWDDLDDPDGTFADHWNTDTTGCKPTLRTYEMICLYLQGWADEEELLAHLQKLKPHSS